jgi:hypothetical protein
MDRRRGELTDECPVQKKVYRQVDKRRPEEWSDRQTEDRVKVHWTARGRVMVD